MYEEKVNSKEDQSARPTYYPATLWIFKVSGPSFFLCAYLEALWSLYFCLENHSALFGITSSTTSSLNFLSPTINLRRTRYTNSSLKVLHVDHFIMQCWQQKSKSDRATKKEKLIYTIANESQETGMRIYDNSNKLFCLRARRPAAGEENDINWDKRQLIERFCAALPQSKVHRRAQRRNSCPFLN